MNESKRTIVVIGGGITGLSAAYYLQKHIKDEGLPWRCLLIDSSPRLGGKIQTAFRDGYVIEKGPDSFLASKSSPVRLAREIGMEEQLVRSRPGKSYVLLRDRLHAVPGGENGIPAKLTPFAASTLFSPLGKLRAAADLLLPAEKLPGDRSLGEFFKHRLGTEVLENFIEPQLSGIYTGDIEKLSLQSTFPLFHEIEQEYGSLIAGMKKSAVSIEKATGKDGFLTFKTGLQPFADAIEQKLDHDSVIKGVKVEQFDKTSGGYKLYLNNHSVLTADAVLFAAGHQAASQLLEELVPVGSLKEMESTSVATVVAAFDQTAVRKDFDGSSFVVRRNSDYSITSFTWIHKKWPHAVPKGKVLMRCYVGRTGDEAIINLPDEEIVKIVLEDLRKIMEIRGEPDFSIVTRWNKAMPQYQIGHKERIEAFEQSLKSHLPGVFAAGSSFSGIGMPDCIDQAEKAAADIAEYLSLPAPSYIPIS